MPYTALKSVKFDKQYAAGSTVPDKAVAPEMAWRLEAMGLIQKQKKKEKENFSLDDLSEMIEQGRINKKDMLSFAETFILENSSEVFLKDNDISGMEESNSETEKTEHEKNETPEKPGEGED